MELHAISFTDAITLTHSDHYRIGAHQVETQSSEQEEKSSVRSSKTINSALSDRCIERGVCQIPSPIDQGMTNIQLSSSIV